MEKANFIFAEINFLFTLSQNYKKFVQYVDTWCTE